MNSAFTRDSTTRRLVAGGSLFEMSISLSADGSADVDRKLTPSKLGCAYDIIVTE